jgi:protein Hikeshi
MFGIIVSGRPVLTEFTTVSPTQLAFTIPAFPPFNHLVVFLLPGNAIPPDQSAAVYIQLPPKTDFQLLGALSSEKPSAIFRTRGVGAVATGMGVVDEDAMVDSAGDSGPTGNIVIGISMEPATQVQQALQTLKAQNATPRTGLELVKAPPPSASSVTTKLLAQRIIGNAFNFLASFGSDVIPLKAFEDWWKKFERKIEVDPTFLEREGGA